MQPDRPLVFSGDTFEAAYRILVGTKEDATAVARDICVEQTVEFPPDLISRTDILEGIVGKTRSLKQIDETHFDAKISYAAETVGTDFVQFLNVLFGNSGLKPGIRLMDFSLPETVQKILKGPRFGAEGLRTLTGKTTESHPLLATALKPMGYSNETLASFAAAYAEGGIDIIKDDHGLADQGFTRFEDRVRRVAAAVNEANIRFSKSCLYFANITGPADQIVEKAHFAKREGVGGLMLAPGLTGFDVLRQIATDDEIALPLLSHPAFLGPLVLAKDSGIAHGALFGKLNRIVGADIAVFPSFGGRFSFSEAECRHIVTGLTEKMHTYPALPAPAGGMTVDRIQKLKDFYGNEAVFLIGGDLHRQGSDLAEACRVFRNRVERNASIQR